MKRMNYIYIVFESGKVLLTKYNNHRDIKNSDIRNASSSSDQQRVKDTINNHAMNPSLAEAELKDNNYTCIGRVYSDGIPYLYIIFTEDHPLFNLSRLIILEKEDPDFFGLSKYCNDAYRTTVTQFITNYIKSGKEFN
jgi:hypothetical protein